jgi:hypothetical protein
MMCGFQPFISVSLPTVISQTLYALLNQLVTKQLLASATLKALHGGVDLVF